MDRSQRNAVPLTSLACAAFFVLLPAISVGGALGLPVLMCLAGVLALRPSLLRQAVEKPSAPLVLLVLFAAWAAVSALWSPAPAATQAIQLIAIVGLGLVFAAVATQQTGRSLTQAGGLAAFLALAILLGIEAASGGALNRAAQPEAPLGEIGRNLSRGTTVLIALAWPVIGSLVVWRTPTRTAAGLAVAGAAAILSFQFDQLANAVALAGGLIAFALAYAAPRIGLLTAALGLAIWLLAAPFATPLLLADQRLVDALPLSWAHRAEIWEFVCARIGEQPWIGHGLDASRAVTEQIEVREMLTSRGIPVHPHSASLQIWYDTGLVGAALASGALAAGGVWLARRFGGDRRRAAATAATLATLGVIANVSFSLWAEWWETAMFAAAALLGAISLRNSTGPA